MGRAARPLLCKGMTLFHAADASDIGRAAAKSAANPFGNLLGPAPQVKAKRAPDPKNVMDYTLYIVVRRGRRPRRQRFLGLSLRAWPQLRSPIPRWRRKMHAANSTTANKITIGKARVRGTSVTPSMP